MISKLQHVSNAILVLAGVLFMNGCASKNSRNAVQVIFPSESAEFLRFESESGMRVEKARELVEMVSGIKSEPVAIIDGNYFFPLKHPIRNMRLKGYYVDPKSGIVEFRRIEGYVQLNGEYVTPQ